MNEDADMTPLSVITLNKGRSDHLGHLLTGLARGRLPTECVVVQMGEDRLDRRDLPFAVREVVLRGAGLPLAAARNAGRRAARGSTLVFLDVDCIPSADLVDALAEGVERVDGLICCPVWYLSSDAVGDGWSESDLAAGSRCHPARPFPTHGLERAAHPGLFWSLAFGVRATTFDRIGGFDEAFSGYGGEDTDLAFRADALGVPTLLSATGRAYHQWHAACDPPLQHFDAIMVNADVFRRRHGFWPMQGWLDQFVSRGLVARDGDGGYGVLRRPTADEVAAAAVPLDRPF